MTFYLGRNLTDWTPWRSARSSSGSRGPCVFSLFKRKWQIRTLYGKAKRNGQLFRRTLAKRKSESKSGDNEDKKQIMLSEWRNTDVTHCDRTQLPSSSCEATAIELQNCKNILFGCNCTIIREIMWFDRQLSFNAHASMSPDTCQPQECEIQTNFHPQWGWKASPSTQACVLKEGKGRDLQFQNISSLTFNRSVFDINNLHYLSCAQSFVQNIPLKKRLYFSLKEFHVALKIKTSK